MPSEYHWTCSRLLDYAVLHPRRQYVLDMTVYALFLMFPFSLKWIEESFAAVPGLHAKLQDVRDENMRHSQYVTAMENLKHIFTVPESVEKTKQWISEGKLLHTHQVHNQHRTRWRLCMWDLGFPRFTPHCSVARWNSDPCCLIFIYF